MPDARRLAARSVRICRARGLDQHAAVSTVVKVASFAEQRLLGQGVRDTDWLWEVRLWAARLSPGELAGDVEVSEDGVAD